MSRRQRHGCSEHSLSPWRRGPGLRPPAEPALGARIPVLPLTRTQPEPPAGGPSSQHYINITLLTKTGGAGGGSAQGETRFYLESINNISTRNTVLADMLHKLEPTAASCRPTPRRHPVLPAKPLLPIPKAEEPLWVCSYGHVGHAVGSSIRLIHDLMSLPLVSTTLAGWPCEPQHVQRPCNSRPGMGLSLAQQMEPRAAPATTPVNA